jgi:cell shape-determining protein MreC
MGKYNRIQNQFVKPARLKELQQLIKAAATEEHDASYIRLLKREIQQLETELNTKESLQDNDNSTTNT